MTDLAFSQAEVQALRHEVRRLETMNQAMLDAGKAVVAERDLLRQERDYLGPRFIEDMCDLFGIDRGDLLRMDKIAEAVKELVASANRKESTAP